LKTRNIVILGSTGSIGENAVLAAKEIPDAVKVVGVAAGTNYARVAEQARELGCRFAAVANPADPEKFADSLPRGCEAMTGSDAMAEIAADDDVDLVLCAIVGAASLKPALAAAKAGKTLALASKEALVMAGGILMAEARGNGAEIVPVDSEHSAVAQCLAGRKTEEVSRIILTASGGPFRDWPLERMEKATWSDALDHPTWEMGPKVTVDSATLMNKALEIIEASHLFGLPGGKIDVVIHRQSIVHSMVEFMDGALLAQMNAPDMRFPILRAMTWPEILPNSLPALSWSDMSTLTFEPPDEERFPSLRFAREALITGGAAGTALNAANEVAVERFRKGDIRLTDIWKVVGETLDARDWAGNADSLNEIIKADAEARTHAERIADNLA